jgi:hypothetical protein
MNNRKVRDREAAITSTRDGLRSPTQNSRGIEPTRPSVQRQ